MDGKSPEWRKAAADLLEALARDNKYIVSDMVILFLESANHGLKDYAALGGVFRRAAAAGIIKRIEQPRKKSQSLWISCIYGNQDQAYISEMAGALKARDVLNREMGIDSQATGAYLIDRYHEIWGNKS